MPRTFIAIIGLLFLAACNATPEAKPSVDYQLGDIIYQENFDNGAGDWEEFGYIETQFGVVNGTYAAISPGGGYITVTNQHVHSNVVIDVKLEQQSADNTASYGVVCRSQVANVNVGYYFLINGGGHYGIRIGDGGRIRMLVPWTEHQAINQDLGAINTMRVVCIDDYLALYINDTFVAEARYDWLKEGRTGFVVNSVESVTVAVQYDDLTIWEASLGD